MAIIKDRGIQKWQPAFKTPELSKSQKLLREDYFAETKPIFDEQHFDYLNQIVYESMEYLMNVEITYYHHRSTHIIIGMIHHFDEMTKTLKVINTFGHYEELMLENILEINFYEE